MGLLDGLFGGNKKGGGGMSPITLGLLALLAYRTYQGKGRLADMLGRDEPEGATAGTSESGGRVTGPGRLPDGNPAGSAPANRDGGGLGDILGGLLGGGAGTRRMDSGGAAGGGGLGDLLRGGLGGLLGGAAAGTVLNGGLSDLLKRFQQHGQGETANSWVDRGPNREVTPEELEQAVGRDTLEELSTQTGRPYNEVLSELSKSLPDTVDKLTPEGRVATEAEAARWI